MHALLRVTALVVVLLLQFALVGNAYACERHTGDEQGMREHAMMSGAHAAASMPMGKHQMAPTPAPSSCDGSSGQMPCGVPSGSTTCASMVVCGSTVLSTTDGVGLSVPLAPTRVAVDASAQPPARTYPPEPPPPRA